MSTTSSVSQTCSPVKEVSRYRDEYVLRWLEDNKEFFSLPPIEPRIMTRVSDYTFGPPEENYHYSQPVPLLEPIKPIQLPFITLAPHRISPMVPVYEKPLRRFYSTKLSICRTVPAKNRTTLSPVGVVEDDKGNIRETNSSVL